MIDKLLSQLSDEGPLILLFHGVIEENDYEVRNYIRKHIEKDYFIDVMKTLQNHGTALSMDVVVDIHDSNMPYPANSFVVTFDDGFENNYSVAAPVLDNLNIPAIFYITSDFVENGTMSWTDKAEHALEETLQGAVELSWAQSPMAFSNKSEKINFMKDLRSHIFQNPDIDVKALIDDLYQQLDLTPVKSTDDPLDKKLSWEQVSELHNHELFTIGGHTHTHIIMSFVPQEEMEAEIDLNLKFLREKSGVETRHFAYPQGQENHYNETVIASLKARDIVCCPTAIEGMNKRDTSLFDLYRTMVV